MPAGLLDGSVDLAACPDAALVLNAPGMPELKVGGGVGWDKDSKLRQNAEAPSA